MKVIAKREFANVPKLRLMEQDENGVKTSLVEGVKHVNHIYKGAIFEIGATCGPTEDTLAKKIAKVRKADPDLGESVAILFHYGCVGDAEDPKVVAAVKEEIRVNEQREANAKARESNSVGFIDQLAQLLATAKPATARK